MTDEPTNDRDALNRFWNELVQGESARPDDLDPALAATIYRLHALRSSPVPIVARSRVRRQVMAGVAPAPAQPKGAAPRASLAARGPVAPPSPTPIAPPRRRFRHAGCLPKR